MSIENVLKIIILIDASVMTIIILMQSGKADGFSAAITGGNKSLNLFSSSKSRGSDLLLDRLSAVTVIIFIILATILRIL